MSQEKAEEEMKPDPVKYAKAKASLIRRLGKIIRDFESLIADIDWWNEHRTDAPPFGVGGDIVTLKLFRQCLALVEADQPLPDELWERAVKQAEANAARN